MDDVKEQKYPLLALLPLRRHIINNVILDTLIWDVIFHRTNTVGAILAYH